MDSGRFLKEPLIFAALEANQITLPYTSADNLLLIHLNWKNIVIVKEIVNLETGMHLICLPAGCHLKTYIKARTKFSSPEAFINGKAVSKSSKRLKTIFSC